MLENLPWVQFCKNYQIQNYSRQLQIALTRNKFITTIESVQSKRHCAVNICNTSPALSTDSSFQEYNSLLMEKMVYLTTSNIHHIGIFAARQFENDQMVIEYMGEVLESNLRRIIEDKYTQEKRLIYTIRYYKL